MEHLIALKIYDQHYDLILVVGTAPQVKFGVCSRSLARFNRVFDKMLYGLFLERKPATGEWVVNLPEDNPSAFMIILKLVHGDHLNVPDQPNADTLYHLVATIHYYNIVDAGIYGIAADANLRHGFRGPGIMAGVDVWMPKSNRAGGEKDR
ncbi:hypothetical protein AAE478_008190 [Parahypoxylon ruwenzoriense]